MSFYVIEISNNRFWIKKKFIQDVHDIMWNIRLLCKRHYDISFIKSYLTNFNNDDKIVQIPNEPNFSSKKVINYDVVSYLNEHNNYLHTTIINLLEQLLSSYSENALVIKTLFQLINIIERVPLLEDVIKNQTKISLRLKGELSFIIKRFSVLIYREFYIAYLQSKFQIDDIIPLTTNTYFTINNADITPTSTNNIIDKIKLYEVFKLVLNGFFIVDIREIKNLILVNKDLCTLFNPQECMPIFRNNLKDIIVNIYNLDYEIFTKLLLKVNGIISGSSVLQCILGNWKEYSKSSNLNIYVQEPGNKEENIKNLVNFLNFLIHRNYKIQEKTLSSLIQTHENVNFGYHGFFISEVQTYKHFVSRRSIQITYINNTYNLPLGELVASKFDISFLKNYFDGHDIHTYCLNDIIKRTGVITQEILKKCSYNYDGIYHIETKDLYKYLLFNTELHIRILKYLSRGFKIIGYEEFKNKSIFY